MVYNPTFTKAVPIAMVITEPSHISPNYNQEEANALDKECQDRVDMRLTSQRHYIGIPNIHKTLYIGETLGCDYYKIGGGNVIGDQYQ
jgi:hypothetical protein